MDVIGAPAALSTSVWGMVPPDPVAPARIRPLLSASSSLVKMPAGLMTVCAKRRVSMKTLASILTVPVLVWLFSSPSLTAAPANVVRGADELFWVPTLPQALAMAKETGRPLFLMGYSLVPDGSTYTKLAGDYCSGVF